MNTEGVGMQSDEDNPSETPVQPTYENAYPVLAVPVADIKANNRFRKDMGDLSTLAESIKSFGLLHPIGITKDKELVFGGRRLEAHKLLNRKTIQARIVDVEHLIVTENEENKVRKEFTISERTAIAKAIREKLGNRQGQRSDLLPLNCAEVGETRKLVAKKSCFSNHTKLERAEKVEKNGTAKLIEALDRGEVSLSAAALVAELPPEEQDRAVDSRTVPQVARAVRDKRSTRETVPTMVLGGVSINLAVDPLKPIDIPFVLQRVAEEIQRVLNK